MLLTLFISVFIWIGVMSTLARAGLSTLSSPSSQSLQSTTLSPSYSNTDTFNSIVNSYSSPKKAINTNTSYNNSSQNYDSINDILGSTSKKNGNYIYYTNYNQY